jgi:cell fate regulator YaaT (PSP1 superfamily)
MACGNCSVGSDKKPGGCNGSCSGGCNRMNTFDWLAQLDIHDAPSDFDLVEVSFKKGSRKDFFHNPANSNAGTGDMVLVEIPGGGGFDVGEISLMGDMVRLQMKKKMVKSSALFLNVIRRANPRDVEKLQEVRTYERDMMIRGRAIARTLDLDMKIGDVEFQGDGRKVTFLYTADGRVDFRELIRHFAKEFKVKIEMRQIGARQESGRVGGIGTCGRELCCSTWLSDFKSVSTVAARYQQLAINQAKLSGMCGRLKCCLNYELDTYLDAMEDFPSQPERLMTRAGKAELIKTDVFRALMTYVMTEGPERGKFFTIAVSVVKDVISMNKRGEMPADLKELQVVQVVAKPNKNSSNSGSSSASDEDDDDDYDDEESGYGSGEDLVGNAELSDDKRRRKKKKKKKGGEPDRRPTDNREGNRPQNDQNRDRNREKGQNKPPRDGQDKPKGFQKNAPRDGQDKPQGFQNKPLRDGQDKPQGFQNKPLRDGQDKPQGFQNKPPREPRDGQDKPQGFQNKPPREGQDKPQGFQNKPPREPREGQDKPQGFQNKPPREPRDGQDKPQGFQNKPPREPRDGQDKPQGFQNKPPREPREGNLDKPNDNQPPRDPNNRRNDRRRPDKNRNRDNQPPRDGGGDKTT